MVFERIVDAAKGYSETHLAISIAVGCVFLLFMIKKPKYFIIVVSVLAGGLFLFELFQKLAVKTGLGGF